MHLRALKIHHKDGQNSTRIASNAWHFVEAEAISWFDLWAFMRVRVQKDSCPKIRLITVQHFDDIFVYSWTFFFRAGHRGLESSPVPGAGLGVLPSLPSAA